MRIDWADAECALRNYIDNDAGCTELAQLYSVVFTDEEVTVTLDGEDVCTWKGGQFVSHGGN
jgi:hypothetical protein